MFLPRGGSGNIGAEHLPDLLDQAAASDAAVIGPGLSTDPESVRLARDFIASAELPLIIDGDALTALAGREELCRNREFPSILTPHPGEMARLLGSSVSEVEARRIDTALEAAERAISHPLLEDISICGAKGVLINITSNSDLTMEEMTEASERIYNEVGENADIIWGTVIDDTLGDEMRVTVIATGIGNEPGNLARSAKIEEFAPRGRIRDLTPAEMQTATNLDEPTFLREQKAVGESSGATYRGYKGIIIDNNDLDVPTFLRRKAD